MSHSRRVHLIAAACARLRRAGVEAPERDARLMLRWAAGLDGAAFSARLDDPAAADEAARFEAAVKAREARIPVAQITGRRAFWGRSFRVTAGVLDPRPETESLVAAALEGPRAKRVLDLGTGSGCILLTLLAEWPEARGTGTDISPAALAVATENAAALAVDSRVTLTEADWCDGLAGSYNLIVSNPPYITTAEFAALAPEVRLHEPRLALTPHGDPGDGLTAYRRIAAGIGALLAPGGRVLLETGPTQGAAVAALIAACGLTGVSILPDLDGRDRVVAAIAA